MIKLIDFKNIHVKQWTHELMVLSFEGKVICKTNVNMNRIGFPKTNGKNNDFTANIEIIDEHYQI